jgi:hypothetical protein
MSENKSEIINLHNEGFSVVQIASKTKYSKKDIFETIVEGGFVPRKFEPDENIKIKIINAFLENNSVNKTSKMFNLCFQATKSILVKSGLKIDPAKYHVIDESFFETIDSHEKAYYIGLIMSDGCLLWNRRKDKVGQLLISLVEADKYILENLISLTKSSTKLRVQIHRCRDGCVRQPMNGLCIASEVFVSHLTKYGLFPNKSVNHPFFKNIPEEFLSSAILGYFDGDGSVSILRQNTQLCASFISSIEFSKELYKTLLSKNIKCSIRVRKTKKGTEMGEVRLKGNNQCLKLYRYMYSSNIPSLTRKKLKFETMIDRIKLGLTKDTSHYS